MLKKEFKRKDVDRMRNLITGNVNDSSETQIGYTKKIVERKEGDIWKENILFMEVILLFTTKMRKIVL